MTEEMTFNAEYSNPKHQGNENMNPTTGRIVHFCAFNEQEHPQPAIVVFVENDGLLNLFRYPRWYGDAEGLSIGVLYSKEPKPGHWSWPPINKPPQSPMTSA